MSALSLSTQIIEILELLAKTPRSSGLELIKASQHLRRGTIYVLLSRLEERHGWVTSEAQEPDPFGLIRFRYSITDSGRKVLEDYKNTTTTLSPEFLERLQNYKRGRWFNVHSVHELYAFYQSILPALRDTARDHGYALALHGSQRRDLDLIAVPWTDTYSDRDVLAKALAMTACGLTRQGPYEWEQKPHGRIATSFPICWPEWVGGYDIPSLGHIDLSIAGYTA